MPEVSDESKKKFSFSADADSNYLGYRFGSRRKTLAARRIRMTSKVAAGISKVAVGIIVSGTFCGVVSFFD